MTHGDQHWHASDTCFACNNCNVGLLGKPFIPREGSVYCTATCMRKNEKDFQSREHSIESSSFEEEIKTLSTSDKNIESFFRLGSSSLSTTASSRFSFTKCPNLDVLPGTRPTTRRENSPTPSDIALRENLRNPAPPKSPPEIKKVLRKSQKNYWKRKEEPDYNQYSFSAMSKDHQKQNITSFQSTSSSQLQNPHCQMSSQQQQKPIDQSFDRLQPPEQSVAQPKTSQDLPRRRNESAADRKQACTSGSESTEDFSSFRPVSTVQQLLSLYSQENVTEQNSGELAPSKSSTEFHSTNDGSTFDSRAEASRQMLEKNLELLIVQQGLDAISQLTYAMTPEQIEKLILRTEQVGTQFNSTKNTFKVFESG
jgi:hypothetical protein